MSDIEKHEDEGAKAFDKHLARRLLRYLKPYRARAAGSVALVILSSLMWATYTIALRYRPLGMHLVTFLFIIACIGDAMVLSDNWFSARRSKRPASPTTALLLRP